jgi:hypothetical protein
MIITFSDNNRFLSSGNFIVLLRLIVSKIAWASAQCIGFYLNASGWSTRAELYFDLFLTKNISVRNLLSQPARTILPVTQALSGWTLIELSSACLNKDRLSAAFSALI